MMGILEYSEIQYRLWVSPTSRVTDIRYAIYRGLMPTLGCKIFIADDFTLNGKSTYLESVVKSSKIITGRLLHTPNSSFVLPIIKDFPAVRTGTLYLSE